MACPHFYPLEPLERAGGGGCAQVAYRLPLMQMHTGLCRASGCAVTDAALLEGCNRGYARAVCPHLSAEDADAVRFSILEESREVIYVVEKDHWPVEHGCVSALGAAGDRRNEVLARQAQVFMDAWRAHGGGEVRW